MSLDFPVHQEGPFRAEAAFHEGVLTLRLSGAAELDAHEALGPLLERAHAEAIRLEATEVIVDLGQLEFMNSSCFKRFVTWLSRAKSVAKNPYAIRFLSNPRARWQRASLAALRCFAPELIQIEALAPIGAARGS